MAKPKFKNGLFIIEDYAHRKLELQEHTWKHIIQEREKAYFEYLFDKIIETIKDPLQVRQSTKEKNVVIYERFFGDFFH